jgi:anaerobic magnesium-protoporphyrin IX monomethyl ester cyclase
MKKVLFVVLPYMMERGEKPSTKLRGFVAFPYGVLSIATYLKKKTNTVIKIFDCNLHDNFKEELAVFNPDIVALSMMFDNSYQHVKDIVEQVNDWNSNVLIVMGGAATREVHNDILNDNPEIDAVCYGEGEIPFLNLVNSIDGEYIFQDTAWVVRGPTDPPKPSKIQNLDEVIELDYSFVNIDDYRMEQSFAIVQKPNAKQFFIISSRGCPFKCTFCMNSANPDKTVRYASVDAVIRHVRYLVDKFCMNVLTFYDDQLLFDRKRAKELFRQLAQFNLRIDCPNGLTVAFIDDELAGLMRAAGMDTVKLAIESGSPYVLNELINKPLKIHQVKPVVDKIGRAHV